MNCVVIEYAYNEFMIKRLFYFLMDGFGCGETEDASQYGDAGANTSRHILENAPFLTDSYLYELGLFHCLENKSYCFPQNPNKDTFSCTQEMFHTLLCEFKTFPNGFPQSVVETLETITDCKFLGNKAASGTEIIQELGEEARITGNPILYTSADSVMQIASHVESFSLSSLYYLCEIARNTFCHSLPIGRVIARPFLGNTLQGFYRTSDRKDFVYPTEKNSILHTLSSQSIRIYGNRIFQDIFLHNSIIPIPGTNNQMLYDFFIQTIQSTPNEPSLYLINLEDFDMLFGHRRDVNGYAEDISRFSNVLYKTSTFLQSSDRIIISADHGNDPTFKNHTDHTREYTPFLTITATGSNTISNPKPLSFIGQSILDYFENNNE